MMSTMRRFTACDSDPALSKFLDNHTPVESVVTLKVGAQVMLLKNLNVSTIILLYKFVGFVDTTNIFAELSNECQCVRK